MSIEYSNRMLTKRQKKFTDFIERYTRKKGYAPSYDEIRKGMRLRSVSTVHYYVSKLKKSGIVQKIAHKARSITVFCNALLFYQNNISILDTLINHAVAQHTKGVYRAAAW